MSFIRPVQRSIYNIFDPKGLKFLTCLRSGFSHLNEHRCRHNFQDCLNPLCSCSLEIEDASYYLLHCHHFSHHRVVLMNSVKSICDKFDSMPDNVKEDLLLFGDSRFDENKNILEATIIYTKNFWKILWFPTWMFCHWMISIFKRSVSYYFFVLAIVRL